MSSQSKSAERSHQEIEEYWTPERRKNAIEKPFEPPTLPPSSVPAPGTEEPQGAPGYNPDRDRDRASATSGKAEALPAPNPVVDPNVYPWRTIGTLFFTSDGKDYVGSACVIAQRGLLTVAHNLYDVKTKSWSDNLWFYPAYDDGGSAYGAWSWDKMWIKDEWNKPGQHAYDVGLVLMREAIGDAVGWLGYQVDRTVERSWIDVGYPGDLYKGERMMSEEGYYTRMLDDNKVVGKQGEMSEGASGGPWLLFGDNSVLNGLHSFRKPDTYPGEVFSPYFATWVAEFIRSHLG